MRPTSAVTYPTGRLNAEWSETGECTWTWTGGSVGILREYDLAQMADNPLDDLQPGAAITIGGQDYRILEHRFMESWYVVMRADKWPGWWLLWDRVARSLTLAQVCVVRLAYIWGLAHRPEGQVYSWRCIYFIDWLARKFERGKRADTPPAIH